MKNSELRIKIEVDGSKLKAFHGEYLIDVLKRNGIAIPSLCNVDGLEPYAACRLCIVKIIKDGRERIVTSCNYPVREPVQVKTNDEKLKRLRKNIALLMLKLAPASEKVREIAVMTGVEEKEIELLENVNEKNRCIICGLCVRICSEVVGANAISFAMRGKDRYVALPFNEMNLESCIACGACSYVCPTGCIDMEGLKLKKIVETVGAGERACRYSLMGLLPGVICDNDYDCPSCFIDRRMIELAQGKHPVFLLSGVKNGQL